MGRGGGGGRLAGVSNTQRPGSLNAPPIVRYVLDVACVIWDSEPKAERSLGVGLSSCHCVCVGGKQVSR